MNLRAKTTLGVCLLIGSAALMQAASVGTVAPDVRVSVPSTGAVLSTASMRGEIVLVQFLLTECSHCQQTAAMLSRLQAEFKGRGLKIVGAAIDDGPRTSAAIDLFRSANHVEFPVGYADRQQALGALDIPAGARFVVPQILIIGRDGRVRAKSEPMGSPELQDEESLRTLLGKLLYEKPQVTQSRRR